MYEVCNKILNIFKFSKGNAIIIRKMKYIVIHCRSINYFKKIKIKDTQLYDKNF